MTPFHLCKLLQHIYQQCYLALPCPILYHVEFYENLETIIWSYKLNIIISTHLSYNCKNASDTLLSFRASIFSMFGPVEGLKWQTVFLSKILCLGWSCLQNVSFQFHLAVQYCFTGDLLVILFFNDLSPICKYMLTITPFWFNRNLFFY